MKKIVKMFLKLLCLSCLVIFSTIPSQADIINLAGHNPNSNSNSSPAIGVTEKDITGYTIHDYSITISLTDDGVKKVNEALTPPTVFDSLNMYYKDIYLGHSMENTLIASGSNELTFDYIGFALIRPEIENHEEILIKYLEEAGIKRNREAISSHVADDFHNLYYFIPVILIILGISLCILVFLLIKNFRKFNDIFKATLKNIQRFLLMPYIWKGIVCTVILVIIVFGAYKGIEVTSLPKCDSDFAIKEVEEIFKQNSQIYNYQNSVGQVISLVVDSPRIDRYDRDAHKYYCLATVKLHVTGNYSNGYTHYDTEVSYNITKSKGKPLVFASFRGKGMLGIY